MIDDACATSSAFRSARVVRIRAAIADGTYVVDPLIVARAIIARTSRARSRASID